MNGTEGETWTASSVQASLTLQLRTSNLVYSALITVLEF
jgi:hypothetical protein